MDGGRGEGSWEEQEEGWESKLGLICKKKKNCPKKIIKRKKKRSEEKKYSSSFVI